LGTLGREKFPLESAVALLTALPELSINETEAPGNVATHAEPTQAFTIPLTVAPVTVRVTATWGRPKTAAPPLPDAENVIVALYEPGASFVASAFTFREPPCPEEGERTSQLLPPVSTLHVTG
jgi:hypothetical protein